MSEKDSDNTRTRRLFWATTIGGVLLLVLIVWLVDLKPLHDKAEQLNGALVFVLVALLPLVGVPVSFLYAVAGAKYGHTWGLIAAIAAICVHLLGSYWLAHSYLRKPLDKLMRKLRYRMPQIPEGEYVPVCLLTALIPGAPYTAKNYLLVLAGTPFRPYFWTLLPSHFFHAALGVLFGDFTGAMTTPKIIFLVVYAIVLAGVSHHVVRRLRRHHRVKLRKSD